MPTPFECVKPVTLGLMLAVGAGCATQTNVVVHNGDLFPEATRALTECFAVENYHDKRLNCLSSDIQDISPRAVRKAREEYRAFIDNATMKIQLLSAVDDQDTDLMRRLMASGADPTLRYSDRELTNSGSESKTETLVNRAVRDLNINVVRLLLQSGAPVNGVTQDTMGYVGVGSPEAVKIALLLLDYGYTPTHDDLARSYNVARRLDATDLDLFYFTSALNAAPADTAAPFRALYDQHLRYLVCQASPQSDVPSACPRQLAALTDKHLRDDRAKREIGMQVCQPAESPAGSVFMIGFVEKVSDDHIQVRVTEARLRNEPWNVVNNFQSQQMWDHIDRWYVAGPNASCPDYEA